MEVSGKKNAAGKAGNAKQQEKVCGPCRGDGINTQANGLCKECGGYMCNSCLRQHLRVKSCRHHVIVDANVYSVQFAGTQRKCTKHNGESIRFYCRSHEVVGCGDCMVFEHKTCNSEYISNVSKNIQQSEEYKMLMSKIEKLASENKENDEKINEKQRGNKMMLEAVLGDIRKFRLDINKYLERVEADVISEAKHIISENDKVLAKLGQDCKQLASKIDKIKQMLNTKVFKENQLFINTVECEPSVFDIENTIAEGHSKTTKTIKFVCDEQLRSIITSTRKLGTFDVSTTILRRQTAQLKENKTEMSDSSESSSGRSDETFKIGYYTNKCKKRESSSRKYVQRRVKSASTVVVGSRVQCNWLNHEYSNEGSVTAVNPDGTVNVKWGNGRTDGRYRVGIGLNGVSLV